MCGRFTLTLTKAQLEDSFPGVEIPSEIQPRFNIAPTQPVAVIANNQPDKLDHFVWGLIPSWAKDPQIGSRMINARAETLVEKPSFRTAFKRRRCLIPSDGFFEWRQIPGQKGKQPMYIKMQDGKAFAFAGLWELWNAPDGGQVLSCTIITTAPNALMEPIHNRMPVILPRQAYSTWLQPGEVSDLGELQSLLQPYPPEEMVAFPVSRAVNSPSNELPECVLPLAES